MSTAREIKFEKQQPAVTVEPMRFVADRTKQYGDPARYWDAPAGVAVTIRSVESHGSNPWRRYSVVTADGHTASGVYPAKLRRP